MLECCKNLAKPKILESRDGLKLKVWFEDFTEDYLEVEGDFGRDIFENGLLADYMKYGFHQENCIKRVAITRIVIQHILKEVSGKLFALYLCVVDLSDHITFSVEQHKAE